MPDLADDGTIPMSQAPQGRSRRRLLGAVTGLPVFAMLTAIGQDEAEARRKGRGRKRSHRPGRKKNNRKGKRKGAATCHVCPDGCKFSSVQAAHDAAQDGDKIILCEGTYAEAVTITKNVTLTGRAGNQVVLQGDGSGTVVTVQPKTTVTISGRTSISGGTGTLINGVVSGGGIVNWGTLTVTGGAIVIANTAARGGGIYNDGTLMVTGADTRIHDNTATTDGGGIYNERGADVTIDNAQVHKNAATGNGGGIFNSGMAHLIIQNNAQVNDNTAAQGAGIYSTVGFDSSVSATMTDSSVTGNVASEIGGGIFNVGGPVTLKSSTVFQNTAKIAGGIFNTAGGVITLDSESAVVDNDPTDCVGTDACDE
jgi:hypothetical protein